MKLIQQLLLISWTVSTETHHTTIKVDTRKKYSKAAKSIDANEVYYTLIKVIFPLPPRPGLKKTLSNSHCTPR